MSQEDIAAGKIKQVRGKAKAVVGAIQGDTMKQVKGNAERIAGKVQEKIGKATSKRGPAAEDEE
jgi:uncharacterized protein YjbJ (UPF0337 family)